MTLPPDLAADEAAVVALATRLGRLLAPSGRMLATVESCTGGLIARALTETPGSSAWFDRGFITYSNQAKTELVGVPEALLAQHGAVSEPVARAMAEGGLARSAAFLAMSVTGVAGPGGGSPDKPVGLVCFGWALRGEPSQSATHRFEGDRAAVRRQAALFALRGALQRVAPRPPSPADEP
ncbi:MAG: CinA family protein [Betaproteobacteria bacterium]|nr:CinA family protein [Betaproteobacteria bacterium]